MLTENFALARMERFTIVKQKITTVKVLFYVHTIMYADRFDLFNETFLSCFLLYSQIVNKIMNTLAEVSSQTCSS